MSSKKMYIYFNVLIYSNVTLNISCLHLSIGQLILNKQFNIVIYK
jgi:hypothetical protein